MRCESRRHTTRSGRVEIWDPSLCARFSEQQQVGKDFLASMKRPRVEGDGKEGTHHETDGRVRFRLVWTDPASVQVSESVSQSVSPCVDCEA